MQISIQTMPHSLALCREIAPIALNKKAQKELGSAIWSDKKHTWFLVYAKDNDINPIGMCAAVDKESYCQFCHDYVLEAYRGEGVYDELFKHRMRWLGPRFLCAKAACTKMSVGTYLRNGFVAKRETKNYTFVELF